MKTMSSFSFGKFGMAFGAMFAAGAAFAAEVAWNGDGEYEIAEGDVMTFSANATITSNSKFTGSGGIVVTGGQLMCDYKITETPFADFTGYVQIDSGATLKSSSPSFAEDGTYATSFLGANTKIVFNGGTLQGFYGQNNSQIAGAVVVNDGTESWLNNIEATSLNGVNLRVRSTASFTGAGTLHLNSKSRWVEFASGVDFSNLTGTMIVDGVSDQNCNFYGSAYGANASWVFDAARTFNVQPQNDATVVFGQLLATNTAAKINFGSSNTTLELGGKGLKSEIAASFTGNTPNLHLTAGELLVSGEAAFNAVALEAGTVLRVTGVCSVESVSGDGDIICEATGRLGMPKGTLVPNISGTGTFVFTNGTTTASFVEAETNYFHRMHGTLEFAAGGHLNFQPTGGTMSEGVDPLGDNKLRFTGGKLQGWAVSGGPRNNVTIKNDIEVVAGYEDSTIYNNGARSANYCNLLFKGGKWTGSGTIEIWHGWNSSRTCDLDGADLSEFKGFINFTGGGYNKIKQTQSFCADAGLNLNLQDHLMLEHASGTTLKIGSLGSTRTDGNQYIQSYNVNQTLEVGGDNRDATLTAKFTGNALKIRKTGIGCWTFGETASFIEGTTFEIDPAAGLSTLAAPGEADPTSYALITVPSGFAATVVQPGDGYRTSKGKWKVVASAGDDGSVAYSLDWKPYGLVIMFR